jgi:hypothetical protein
MNQHAMGRTDATLYLQTPTLAVYTPGSGMCDTPAV